MFDNESNANLTTINYFHCGKMAMKKIKIIKKLRTFARCLETG